MNLQQEVAVITAVINLKGVSYLIIGIDAGNYMVKVVGPRGMDRFSSCLGEARERKLITKYGDDDMVYEWMGRRGFAGSLAKFESEFVRSIKGDTKAHEDAQLRVLLALHRYCHGSEAIQLVVGQPIKRHEHNEKEKIKQMLRGQHTITVNGETKRFNVQAVEVAAEGAGAYWCNPQPGIVRVMDFGSGTINLGTIWSQNHGKPNWSVRFIDKDSDTLDFGMETNKSRDSAALANAAASRARDMWKTEDMVLVAGGAAEEVLPYVKLHFPNACLISPALRNGLAIEILHQVFANAAGFYELGRVIYGS